MRNLKRALSLAMASVMLLGLMVVGTSAASYTDVTSKENQEAIEVLKAVGIMTGDEKGNFNPTANVTRNEMAVVMANLMDYRVASYKGTAPFSDVPAWAEPYVAACYTNGIVAGTSATTFGGEETVTTAQAALMLMKALGYFQYQSDFDDDWQLATVKQGNKIDLFDKVDSGVTEAMTRNDVAQLVLNTLESGMVEADADITHITAGDVKVEANNVTYNYVTSQKSYARAINTLTPVGATSISTAGYIVELGEKLYDGDLKKYEDQTDSYGRPGTEWKYKLDSIGTFSEEPLAVYYAKVSKGDLYSLLGKDRIDDVKSGDANFYTYCAGAYVVDDDASLLGNYFLRNSSDAMGKGGVNEAGKGVQTEIYLDENTGKITIVSIPVFVMQATADYNENKGTLTVDVLTGPANITSLDDDDFDISSYKEDDFILYTVSNGTLSATDITNGDVEEIAPATVVTGEVTAYSSEKSVTLDGTKYDYALWADGSKKENGGTVADSVATEYRVGDTASIVVDANGYALYVDDAAVSLGNYLYVAGAAQKSGLGGDYIAKVYFTDGTKKEVTLDKVYEWNSGAGTHDKLDLGTKVTSPTTQHTIDGWYTYSVNSDGEYTLRESKTWTTATGTLVDEKVTFIVGGAARGNNNTTLIVDDGDDISVYTGIKNFPETKTGKTVTVAYMKEKDNASKTYASVGIILTDTDSLDSKSNDTMLFVLDEDSHYVDTQDNERIDVMNVILNGEKTTVECKHGDLSTYTLYTKVKVDSDGYYEGSQVFTSDTDQYKINMAIGSSDDISYSNGSMTIANHSYIVTDDTKITVILRPTTADNATDELKDEIMTDPDADYEYFLSINGKRVDSLLGDYYLTGTAYATADDDGSEILKSLVIVVNGAVEQP